MAILSQGLLSRIVGSEKEKVKSLSRVHPLLKT